MIVLTGTTGNLGSLVLEYLLKLTPASNIIVSTFNTSSSAASSHRELGLQVRHGDFAKPETLTSAYAGGSTLFLVSSPSMDEALRVKQHSTAIDAAITAGVKKIIYTSIAFNSTPDSAPHVMRPHLATEEYLKKCAVESDVTWINLREGCYMESWSAFLGFISLKDDKVVVTADGKVAWVNRKDLAEANAHIIADTTGTYDNQTILLSGETALKLSEVTQLIGEARGKDISFEVVSRDEYIEFHSALGPIPAGWEDVYPSIVRGEASQTSTLIADILGRRQRDIRKYLKELIEDSANSEGPSENEKWAASAQGLET